MWGDWKSHWVCVLSSVTQKLEPEKKLLFAEHMSGAEPGILELLVNPYSVPVSQSHSGGNRGSEVKT